MNDYIHPLDVWNHRRESSETQHGPLPAHGIYLAFTLWPQFIGPNGFEYGDLDEAKALTRSYDRAEHAWLEANCPTADVQYLTCKRYLGPEENLRDEPDFVAVRVIFTDDAQRESFFEAFPDYRPKEVA